jgi:YHS domain-containing protein
MSNASVDPVCGMTVSPDTAKFQSEHQGETIYFCGKSCKEKFDVNPVGSWQCVLVREAVIKERETRSGSKKWLGQETLPQHKDQQTLPQHKGQQTLPQHEGTVIKERETRSGSKKWLGQQTLPQHEDQQTLPQHKGQETLPQHGLPR